MVNYIGLKRNTVKLAEHNKNWAKLFEIEKQSLLKIFGDFAKQIEHIGSTAVPHLVAKPVIDISVGMRSMKNPDVFIRLMTDSGYYYRPGFGHKKYHLVFAKGDEKQRTHYIHIIKYGGRVWQKDLAFRNLLLRSKAMAEEYAKLKMNLAEKFPNDRRKYTAGKSEFISNALRLSK